MPNLVTAGSSSPDVFVKPRVPEGRQITSIHSSVNGISGAVSQIDLKTPETKTSLVGRFVVVINSLDGFIRFLMTRVKGLWMGIFAKDSNGKKASEEQTPKRVLDVEEVELPKIEQGKHLDAIDMLIDQATEILKTTENLDRSKKFPARLPVIELFDKIYLEFQAVVPQKLLLELDEAIQGAKTDRVGKADNVILVAKKLKDDILEILPIIVSARKTLEKINSAQSVEEIEMVLKDFKDEKIESIFDCFELDELLENSIKTAERANRFNKSLDGPKNAIRFNIEQILKKLDFSSQG